MDKPENTLPMDDSEQMGASTTGLVRDLLAGQGYTLAQAFDKISESNEVVGFVLDTERNWSGARLSVDRADGTGHWHVCRFDDEFYTVICDASYETPHREILPGDGLLEFHVRLAGRLTLMTSRTNPVELIGPSLLVWSLPVGKETEEEIPPQREKSVTIYFQPSYLLEKFISNPDRIPVNLARFMLNRDDSINYCTLPLSPEIIGAASSILTADERFQDLLWLNYVHAKSTELICTIVETFDHLSDSASISFNEREIELLRKARKIAGTEIVRHPTIKEIARRIGTNETKLKQGFRALYGETVFDYRNRKRMDHAMDLVMNGEPLSSVAKSVGFKHQTSFTTAFRAYYGFSPKNCRKFADKPK